MLARSHSLQRDMREMWFSMFSRRPDKLETGKHTGTQQKTLQTRGKWNKPNCAGSERTKKPTQPANKWTWPKKNVFECVCIYESVFMKLAICFDCAKCAWRTAPTHNKQIENEICVCVRAQYWSSHNLLACNTVCNSFNAKCKLLIIVTCLIRRINWVCVCVCMCTLWSFLLFCSFCASSMPDAYTRACVCVCIASITFIFTEHSSLRLCPSERSREKITSSRFHLIIIVSMCLSAGFLYSTSAYTRCAAVSTVILSSQRNTHIGLPCVWPVRV